MSRITIGRIVGLFGVRGWVKVYSYTRPPEAILTYNPWWIASADEWRRVELVEGRPQGKGIVACLKGCTDRDRANELIGAEVTVPVSQLPPPKPGEYYWAQLERLRVLDTAGQDIGTVSHLIETGANDVLVVRGETPGGVSFERLIPFTHNVIRQVDLNAGLIRVEWDAED